MKNSVLRYVSVLAMALMLAVLPLEARSGTDRGNDNRGGSRGTHRTERTRSESRSRSSERKSSDTNRNANRNAGTRNSNNNRANRGTIGNAGGNRQNVTRDNRQSHNDNRDKHNLGQGNRGHDNGNGILQGNRGGAAGHRPVVGNGANNSNRPNGNHNNGNHNGNFRPGNGGHNNGAFNGGGHGNHFGPGSAGIARPPKHNGHYRPVAPVHPYRYTMRPPRPVPPGHYRPYIGPRRMSLGQAVLAFTLGSAFNAALDFFFDNGYSVGGFGNDVIYLNNVSMCNYIWPETSLFYNNGMLATQQYCYASPYNDRARFNAIYRDMCRAYGNPYMRNLPSGLSATWMSGGGDYITLEYQPTYSPAGVLNFFTTLTFGL